MLFFDITFLNKTAGHELSTVEIGSHVKIDTQPNNKREYRK